MAVEPTISEVLGAVQGLGARLDKIDARLDDIALRVEEIDAWRKAQPDIRLMLADGKVLLDQIVRIEGELRKLRGVIGDHARKQATSGELAAVHYDLSILQREQIENAGRLLRIEETLNLITP